MAERVFDRETILDTTVNVIPLGIMAFFFVVFLVFAPWGGSSLVGLISLALIVIPFIGLALLTYLTARAL
ncbi:hypothetical protein SAMN05421858_0872 [Haladaptatus litoreus]|uniref:Cox cluster protein n=1 Tax=Haladaptatus litoreus TaxID=553468 RepID=A0A1N6WUD2_9EURY|nr:DUF6684 family protein [Haladaptatus litoreus]SIQ93724.1 hypothetical protein SAMN05421858_0872 [Haladaptatus litoreus]